MSNLLPTATATLIVMHQPSLIIKAAYSTLSPSELLAHVVPQYRIPNPISCKFWYRGVNDTYKVSGSDEDFVLRVYQKDWRTVSEIAFELDAIMYLTQAGATVATPIKRKDDGYITSVIAPEGERHIVVTKFAKGEILKFETIRDANVFGQAVADIHNCSSGFESNFDRYKLDLPYLLDKPLLNIYPYLAHRPEDWKFLREFAFDLSKFLNTTDLASLDYGFCHGDFHGENAHEHANKVMHFDFDCCGFGWRIYDLATFRWVLRLLGKEERLWPSFLAGYRAKREISCFDLNLIEPFMVIRDIWFFGLNAGNSLAQASLNDAYINIHLNFLKQTAQNLILQI